MENLLPAVKSISDLINDFESGKIAVPEIQQQRLRGHPLARLRRFAAEQQEVTWRRGPVWSKRGKTQWVEETEPSLVLYARPLAWFRRNAPTSVVTCVAATWSRLGECNERTFAPAASQ